MLARDVPHPFVRGLLPPVLALLFALFAWAPVLGGCLINPIPTPEDPLGDAAGGGSWLDTVAGADAVGAPDAGLPPSDLVTPPEDVGAGGSDVGGPPDAGADAIGPEDLSAGDGGTETEAGSALRRDPVEGDGAYSGAASMF